MKIKGLQIFFWINVLLISILFLVIVLPQGPEFGNRIASNVLMEQLSIIITLAGIPLALKLFHRKQQQMKSKTPEDAVMQMTRFFYIRIGIINFLIITNLCGFFFLETRNFVFMTLIAIFALAFCYPTNDLFELAEEKNNKINSDLEE